MGNRRRLLGTGGGWRQVAPLVPLVLFAGAFVINLTDDPSVATAPADDELAGRSQVAVPQQTIPGPANLPVRGALGNGVEPGQQPAEVVAGLAGNGIPELALRAYARAQQVLSQADPTCQLPWTLVAAIGRVESDHGRHGRSALSSTGVAVPAILGPRLDGTRTARIADTDDGRYDGDLVFDRAVGPLQFIPGTWRTVGVDGDGDGIRDPQDIDDAAMTAAVYLCSGPIHLADPADLNRAVLRYNGSQPYVDLVVRIANAYASGNWTAMDDQGRRIGPGRAAGEVDPPIGPPGIGPLPNEPSRPPTTRPGTKPSTRQPTGSTTGPAIGDPTTGPSGRSTGRPGTTPGGPTTPRPPAASRPPSSTPAPPGSSPSAPVVARLRTTAGIVIGIPGRTLADLTRAARYCQSELATAALTHPTQQQLQRCVTAYQTGGTAAADQVIRDLLSLLGPTEGLLTGGITRR